MLPIPKNITGVLAIEVDCKLIVQMWEELDPVERAWHKFMEDDVYRSVQRARLLIRMAKDYTVMGIDVLYER